MRLFKNPWNFTEQQRKNEIVLLLLDVLDEYSYALSLAEKKDIRKQLENHEYKFTPSEFSILIMDGLQRIKAHSETKGATTRLWERLKHE